jgi:outer membrane protein assembly factor BamD
MILRSKKFILALALTMAIAGCHHNKVSNPIANLDSKQPDKVLFDRAMDAMKHGKYDVARITLQTLINTYPDSEYIARAKLSVGDSWYAEGTAAAYQQAEVEYKDFITFFPNLPEAAEAQLKIANMHYKQMEKPDRDYTHAMRAEDEYRQLIQQFPDSKLVPQAKQRLREVQEVLAERQYRIGRFYYLRESYPAAVARLKTLTDTYPLYSQADDAMFMLGNAYEREAEFMKNSRVAETYKGRLVKEYQGDAAQAYAHLIERYPISDRANDARERLKALGKPIPTPTKEAIAENKAEEASRGEPGRFSSVMSTFHRGPEDVVRASKVGDPTLVDPQPASAPQLVRSATNTLLGIDDKSKAGSVSVEKVGPEGPPPSDPLPRSDTAAAPDTTTVAPAPAATVDPSAPTTSTGNDTGIGELTPNTAPSAGTAATPPAAGSAQPASATAAPGDTSAAPASGGATAAPADNPTQMPAQVNEIKNGQSDSAATPQASSSSASKDDQGSSSSKKKKKKGLKKMIPF